MIAENTNDIARARGQGLVCLLAAGVALIAVVPGLVLAALLVSDPPLRLVVGLSALLPTAAGLALSVLGMLLCAGKMKPVAPATARTP